MRDAAGKELFFCFPEYPLAFFRKACILGAFLLTRGVTGAAVDESRDVVLRPGWQPARGGSKNSHSDTTVGAQ